MEYNTAFSDATLMQVGLFFRQILKLNTRVGGCSSNVLQSDKQELGLFQAGQADPASCELYIPTDNPLRIILLLRHVY